jgi:hypothetical protein
MKFSTRTPKCNQCDSMTINGVYCHETGCPNMGKTWIEDEGQWVSFIPCHDCGFDVREDTICECMVESLY